MLLIKTIHSWWAVITLLALIVSVSNCFVKLLRKASFSDRDFRLALFALITIHIQLVIGLINYFVSSYFGWWGQMGAQGVMQDKVARLLLVEHPLINLLAVVFITMGWSKHKKVSISSKKFRRLFWFYLLGLVLLLSRLPWNLWFK